MAPTPTAFRTRWARPILALLAAVALLASGCGLNDDPADDLADALEDSLDGSFSYSLAVEADRVALDALGDGAADAAGFLERFSLSGTVDREGGSSLALSIGAGVPLFEARTFGEDLYLNLGINEFLGLAGSGAFDPRDELAPALGALGFEEHVQTAIIDALDGKWIAVEGGIDVSTLQSAVGQGDAGIDGAAAAAALGDALGDDLEDTFERFVLVDSVNDEGDDVVRYEVSIQLRDLIRALSEANAEAGVEDQPALEDLEADLADLPETVPATVVTRDGRVTDLRVDLADPDGQAGSVLLVLQLGDFDDVEELEEPGDASRLTQEEFLEVLDTFSKLTGALPDPAG